MALNNWKEVKGTSVVFAVAMMEPKMVDTILANMSDNSDQSNTLTTNQCQVAEWHANQVW